MISRPRTVLLIVALIITASCGSGESTEIADITTGVSTSVAVATTTTVTTTAETAAPTSSTTLSTTTLPPAPPTTRVVATGSFQGLAGHRGEGEAMLVQDPTTGRFTIRMTNTDIGSGPDLVVYLVQGADRRTLDGAIRVADLVAETGDHNYLVADDIDLTPGEWTVLVWCETFVIEVANATLDVT